MKGMVQVSLKGGGGGEGDGPGFLEGGGVVKGISQVSLGGKGVKGMGQVSLNRGGRWWVKGMGQISLGGWKVVVKGMGKSGLASLAAASSTVFNSLSHTH